MGNVQIKTPVTYYGGKQNLVARLTLGEKSKVYFNAGKGTLSTFICTLLN